MVLQCVLSYVQLYATLWTVAHQAPPSMGFSRQEYWSGLPFPSPGDLPDPGVEPRSPTLQVDALTSEPPGKPHYNMELDIKLGGSKQLHREVETTGVGSSKKKEIAWSQPETMGGPMMARGEGAAMHERKGQGQSWTMRPTHLLFHSQYYMSTIKQYFYKIECLTENWRDTLSPLFLGCSNFSLLPFEPRLNKKHTEAL